MSDADWDDDRPLEDWEYPDDADDDSADSNRVRECPSCGTDVYEDVFCCPICGEHFTREANFKRMPTWMKAAAIAALIAMLAALRFWF